MTPQQTKAYRSEPFPFTGETEREFARALEAASTRTSGSVHELQKTVCRCVRQLKRAGMSPEGVIITMRAYLRHTAERNYRLAAFREHRTVLQSLGDQLSTWCVKEYFVETKRKTEP